MVIEIGRVCMKIAGRDAGCKCVIVDILDDNFVLIDGETRRRKCNINHIEPLKEKIEIKKDAGHDDVKKAFEKLGLKTRETKPKEKKQRPKQLRGKDKAKTEEKKPKEPIEKKLEKEQKTTQ